MRHHEQAQHQYDGQYGDRHETGNPEQDLFAIGCDEHHAGDQAQAVQRIFRQQRVSNTKGTQIRRTVVGDGQAVNKHPDHQHDEIQDAQRHTPVLAQVFGDDTGVILTAVGFRQCVDEQLLEHVHGRIADKG